MELYGLTGGIGMGKSTAGEILTALGVAVVDTDQLAREVVAPGTPGLAAVATEFGPEILTPSGELRRDALARRVFANPNDLARLNALLHPRIRVAWEAQVAVWTAQGVARAAVTIPLLFENHYEAAFASVICVACTAGTQRERLRTRGWSPEDIARRNAAQLPVVEKMDRAHRVVWTEGSRECHRGQWETILTG